MTTSRPDSTRTQRTRLLVTGFERFGSYAYNPTQILVESPTVQAHCATAVLPVEFERAKQALDTAIAFHQPQIVLMLGLAESAIGFRIETQASTETNAGLKDNAGQSAAPNPGASACLPITIDRALLERVLRGAGLPVESSDSAGRFVCNTTLFHALNTYPRIEVGFVHLPFPDSLPLPAGWQEAGLIAMIRAIIDDARSPSQR